MRIGFIFICIGVWSSTLSAQSFFHHQEAIFKASEEQWMVQELDAINHRYFMCHSTQATWVLPTEDELSFFENRITLSDSERTVISSLFFPSGRCNRYLALVSLCDLYFPLIGKKLDSKHLSLEYRYMPLLLSGLNQSIILPGDRCGLWAMDYLSARKYGLRIDSIVDERHGGDFTVEAAVNYLSELNKQFDGDAMKVVIAFRRGVPYVKEKEKVGSDFYNSLDKESQDFIKVYAYLNKLILSTRTVNQLSHYFDIFGQYEGLVVDQNISLSALSAVLNVSEKKMRENNPVFVGTSIESNYRRIPFMLKDTLARKFEMVADSVYQWKEEKPQASAVSKKYYTVKRGDSLGKIAQRHNTTVSQLKKWNRLQNDKVSIGQKLVVFHSSVLNSRASTLLDTKVVREVQSEKFQENDIKSDTLQSENESQQNSLIYTVKIGDSLWKIAQQFHGVSEHDIKKWNNCSDTIYPGQQLKIHIAK